MSVSAAIQKLIIQTLKADAGVGALVADRIFDRPTASVAWPYISLGPSDFVPSDAECFALREETVQIDVWSNYQGGLSEAKQICDAVKTALHDIDAEIEAGKLEDIRVTLVRVFPDIDPKVSHGVVSVTAQVEE